MDDRSVQDMDGGSIDEDIQDSDTPAEHTRHPKALLKRVQGALAARFKRADAMTMAQDAGSGDRTGKSHHHQHAAFKLRAHNARYHGHLQHGKAVIQGRQQLATIVLSNNEYSTSTTATVTLTDDTVLPAASNATLPFPTTTSAKLHERQSSPPSSPRVSDAPPVVKHVSITLINHSPTRFPTASTSTTRRKKPTTATSSRTTTRKRKPTSTKTQSTHGRHPLTRTAPRSTLPPTRSPTSVIIPAEPPPTPQARISNVVHICIARPPATDPSAPPPPPITFTSTVVFPNGVDPPTRATATPTRDSDNKRTSRSRDDKDISNPAPPAITVTDYNCQLTLPPFSRSTRDYSTGSIPILSPSNGLHADNSTLPALGPNAADPTTGNSDNGISDGNSNDDDTSFFATSGGKGTIAGITIASAILLLTLVLFFVRRRKNNNGGNGKITLAGGNRGSASSFGESSGDQASGTGGNEMAHSPAFEPHLDSNMHPEMSNYSGTGPPGSFFVQRRSQPSSLRGTDTPPRATHTNQLDANIAARAISPLAMLQARPQAFIPTPPHHQPHTASRAQHSNEGNASGEDNPSSGSSHGHDPFRDPSSTGHTSINHDSGIAAAFVDKHERRRSGYTSDTYRKRRSRPLSVRNPDSDETRQQEGIESLYMDRTPRSDSSDALYSIDNAPVPDSAGLEYYLGSAVPTTRGNTPVPVASLPSLPPMPQNTLVEDEVPPETPRAPQVPPWAAWHNAPQVPHSLHQAHTQPAYDGIVQDSQAGPSKSIPEFEAHETYAYPQPRAIVSTASSSILSRPQLQPQSTQPPPSFNIHPAATASSSSNLSRVVEQGKNSQQRQHRQSVSSSDGASSRSSLWRAWEHNNRSWVNDGFETPNDVQDVQLGSNAGAVGGGNATSISGYFAWR